MREITTSNRWSGLGNFRTDGLIAGSTSAVISGIPSITFAMVRAESIPAGLSDVLFSLEAVGNVLLPQTSSKVALYASGILLHLILSFGLSQIMAYVLRSTTSVKKSLLFCLLFSAIVHVINLIVLPWIYFVPMMDRLIQNTGFFPHFCDHMAFGTTVGLTLSYLKKKNRSKSV
eukprot:gene6137-8461_t